MYLAFKRIIPPEYFSHNPNIQDNENWTVAMYILCYFE